MPALTLEPVEPPVVSKRPRHICRLELATVPSAVRMARLHTADALRQWGYPSLIETAQLLVSELVTNAIAHTAPQADEAEPCASCLRPQDWPAYGELENVQRITLTLTVTSESLYIEVGDHDPCAPVVREAGPLDEHGRGLQLVASLSKNWNYFRPRAGAKVVWCELAIPESDLPRRRRWIAPGDSAVPVMDDRPTLRRVRDGLRGLDTDHQRNERTDGYE